jgi:hypothetical protein
VSERVTRQKSHGPSRHPQIHLQVETHTHIHMHREREREREQLTQSNSWQRSCTVTHVCKGIEAKDDHVSTVQHHISRTVEDAMISVSILLPKHPELLKRFLLGAACSLHIAQGVAEMPPPPPPPDSRICLTPDECRHALNALLDLVPLTVKIVNDME